MPNIVEALQQASLEAIKQARQTGTKLVIMRDEQLIEITPDEAEAILKKDNGNSKQ